MKSFFTRICGIQDRARMQINLFNRVKHDILQRMDIIINSMANRFIENSFISKKYPKFLDEIDTISLACKE